MLQEKKNWRNEDDWPLPKINYISYYFHSDGNDNYNNGLLSVNKPEDEPSDHFIYDPLDPVPTIGSQIILPGVWAIGPSDQVKA